MRTLLILLLVVAYVQAATLPSSPTAQLLDDALLLWGPYRPNLYLGLRPRLQNSLMIGFMWYNSEDTSHIEKNLRHTCEQNEGMAGYGWTTYDVRSGGTQIINDTGNGIDLVSHFNKISSTEGDQSWMVNLQGKGRVGTRSDQKVTVVFYIANEELKSSLRCGVDLESIGDRSLTPYATCDGSITSQFGFKIDVTGGRQGQGTNDHAPDITAHSLDISSERLWKAKDHFLDTAKEKAGQTGSLTENSGQGNLQFIQMTFRGDFDFNVHYHSNNQLNPTSLSLSGSETEETKIAFNKQFAKVYQSQHPFKDGDCHTFFKSLLSNLMGGIGVFQGTSKVSSDVNAEKSSLDSADVAVTERGPYELFSAVSSRPFFPRGFLWDEGFHLQAILDWDMDLAMTVLTSWFDLMDENGWIAREQILGPEARSKVPPEFQTQYQSYANPPTMFRVLEMFVDRITGEIPYHGAVSRIHDSISEEAQLADLSRSTYISAINL